MAAFHHILNTVQPGATETLPDEEITQLQDIFMQEIMTNEVVMRELEQRLRQALASRGE